MLDRRTLTVHVWMAAVAIAADNTWDASVKRVADGKNSRESIAAATELVKRFQGTPDEARAERLLGNLMLEIPHQGWVAGGVFTRDDEGNVRPAEWSTATCFAHDRRRAVEHLEKARRLHAWYAEPGRLAGLPPADRLPFAVERLECLLDLAHAVARFGRLDITRDDFAGWYGSHTVDDPPPEIDPPGVQVEPYRLRFDSKARPIFERAPREYDPGLSDVAKVLHLLGEVERLDHTADRTWAARADYRRALLARTMFGTDVFFDIKQTGVGAPRRLADRAAELQDHQTLAHGPEGFVTVDLPPEWDVLRLFEEVVQRHPRSPEAQAAVYARANYHLNRRRYAEALREFRSLLRDHPNFAQAQMVRDEIARLSEPTAFAPEPGIRPDGAAPVVRIRHKNVARIRFTVRRLDMRAMVEANLKDPAQSRISVFGGSNGRDDAYAFLEDAEIVRRHLGAEVASFTADIKKVEGLRLADAEISVPVRESGGYWVEGTFADDRKFSFPMLLTRIAIVEHRLEGGEILFWTVDARTGKGVPCNLHLHLLPRNGIGEPRRIAVRTDAQGLHRFVPPRIVRHFFWRNRGSVFGDDDNHTLMTFAVADDGSWAYCKHPETVWCGDRKSLREKELISGFAVADRPVHRPGDTVQFAVHLRSEPYRGSWRVRPTREFAPAAGRRFNVSLHSAVGTAYGPALHRAEERIPALHRATATADAHGVVRGSFRIPLDAPLGEVALQMDDADAPENRGWVLLSTDGTEWEWGAWHNPSWGERVGLFRIEEYRKPDFEVVVEAPPSVRLGDKANFVVRAKYHFGAPLAGAVVKYRVERSRFWNAFGSVDYWDWLYGAGRGRYVDGDHWYHPRDMPHTLINGYGTQLEVKLGLDGTAVIPVDTEGARALRPNIDHIYFLNVEVVDPGRRSVSAEGRMIAARQPHYAFLEGDHAHCRAGAATKFTLSCLTADKRPVTDRGTLSLVLERDGPFGVVSEPLWRRQAVLDDSGRLVVDVTAPTPGRWRLVFESVRAGWRGRPIRAEALLWVLDPLQGDRHSCLSFYRNIGQTGMSVPPQTGSDPARRFGDLFLLPDRRSYRIGETARVLVATDRPGATVLLTETVDGTARVRTVNVAGRCTFVEIPIEPGHMPNSFVTATLVRDGRQHSTTCELVVPPQSQMLKVSITPDRSPAAPGGKGRLTVTVTDMNGKPVAAVVTLAVFDKSVLAIRGESECDIRTFYWGRRRMSPTLPEGSLTAKLPLVDYQQPPQIPGSVFGGRNHGDDPWDDADIVFATPALEPPGWPELMSRPWLATRFPGIQWTTRDSALPYGREERQVFGRRGGDGRFAWREGEVHEDWPQVGGGAGAVSTPVGPPKPAFVEPVVRRKFADTAAWVAAVATGPDGKAQVEIDYPDNATAWKVNAWALTADARVGSGSTEVVSRHDLLVRLMTPRFLVDQDRATISAVVHNELDTDKRVRATLTVDPVHLELSGEANVDVVVPRKSARQVDWTVRVRREGVAKIEVAARTDERSDAVAIELPIKSRATLTRVIAGKLHGKKTETRVEVEIPADAVPGSSRLELQVAPGPVGAMLEALPYLITYPHGCVEQTMSAFLPTVAVARTLGKLDTDLNSFVKSLPPRTGPFDPFVKPLPATDEAMRAAITAGLRRLIELRNSDNGWGWFGGNSDLYHTAYVLAGMVTAADCGFAIDDEQSLSTLRGMVAHTLTRTDDAEAADPELALAAYALSRKPKPEDDELFKRLIARRGKLPPQALALTVLALHRKGGRHADAKSVFDALARFRKPSPDGETVSYADAERGVWWNNATETDAAVLRAMMAIEPNSPDTHRLVHGLMGSRFHGSYWGSTRDTAAAVLALGDYVAVHGRGKPTRVTVRFDDEEPKSLAAETRGSITFAGKAAGRHTVAISCRPGETAHWALITNFAMKGGGEPVANGLGLQRRFLRIETDARGFEREVELKSGDTVRVGDILRIVLNLRADADTDHVCLEDFRPAGCESLAASSRANWWEHLEYRDDRVVSFQSRLYAGERAFVHHVRAETPGEFLALPARLFAMYDPTRLGSTAEFRLRIVAE